MVIAAAKLKEADLLEMLFGTGPDHSPPRTARTTRTVALLTPRSKGEPNSTTKAFAVASATVVDDQ